MKNLHTILLTLWIISFQFNSSISQSARIQEVEKVITTYPFSDPNPVPTLTTNPKIYPYHKFEGYTHNGQNQTWKVVHLENDFIELWVLPEVGGKVWGAREKSTGKEFIYRNEVMKFRNIAMRGPWTSGGIEFNFGIIGHTPATATPVDYKIVEEEDGTVACIVGATDWPSRTDWRVKISLEPDKAYFSTEAMWFNASDLHQPYYNWMTAAAFAKEDLEFYCPGNQYLKHSGEPRPWPVEFNRHIAKYNQNNFTSSKSYHVVGEYNDFFGGYFHKENYGFGHWSLYDEMPGQKLWLWSLARDGGIWEDLLTDTDGQYIEFQAGRLLNQHFSGGYNNPVSQAFFPPHATDTWREQWFPVLEIGGLTDVSPEAVLHVETTKDQIQVSINALSTAKGILKVQIADEIAKTQTVELTPMGVFQTTVDWKAGSNYSISVPEMGLYASNAPYDSLTITRPFTKFKPTNSPAQLYRKGIEHMNVREYEEAEETLRKVLALEDDHLPALTSLAELKYRQGLYKVANDYIFKALGIDTYDPYANYIAGLIYKAQEDWVNAKEALGWAARSLEFRSVAYCLLGEVELVNKNYDLAIHYAQKSLDFNRLNLNAHKVSVIANRKIGEAEKALEHIQTMLVIDPLNHFARYENLFQGKESFPNGIHSELPEQTILELAIDYYNKGQKETSIEVFGLLENHPLALIWLGYIHQAPQYLDLASQQSTDFVFPFRRETLPALRWAKTHAKQFHWPIKYYRALNLWHKNQKEEALVLLNDCGQLPKSPTFFLTRAELQDQFAKEKDLIHALKLDEKNWRSAHALSQHFLEVEDFPKALKYSQQGYNNYPENYSLGLDYVKALIFQKKYASAINVLNNLKVLPFEGASEGRKLYEWAHIGNALELIKNKSYQEAIQMLDRSKAWPESLGVGKPFDPDERMADFLLAYCWEKNQDVGQAKTHQERVVAYLHKFPKENSYNAVLSFALLTEAERSHQFIHVYNEEDLPPRLQWSVAAATNPQKIANFWNDHPELDKGIEYHLVNAIMEIYYD